MKGPSYNDLVFINCPFDNNYQPILMGIIYAVYRCGFFPVTAMEEDNSLDNRIDKIFRIVEKCRFGVHDISRTELNENGLPRFNMPFELGVFFAARRYGSRNQKAKNAVVFEKTPYLYQQYISDINGVDIKSHNNRSSEAIKGIRNWLNTASRRKTIPAAPVIVSNFTEFLSKLPGLANRVGYKTLNEIPFADYCTFVEEAIRDLLPAN